MKKNIAIKACNIEDEQGKKREENEDIVLIAKKFNTFIKFENNKGKSSHTLKKKKISNNDNGKFSYILSMNVLYIRMRLRKERRMQQ